MEIFILFSFKSLITPTYSGNEDTQKDYLACYFVRV
jgi:hypothetical protein